VLAALLWTLAGLLLAALIALAAPFRLRLRAASGAGRVRLDLRLLDGWAPAIPLVDTDRPGGARTEPPPEPERREKTGRGPMRGLDADTLRRLAGLVAEVPSAVHISEARGELALGLGDPADTGAAFGLLSGLAYGVPGGGLALHPVFDRPCLEGAVDATLRIGTPRLLGIALRAARLLFWRRP
jgi:hypothetical protein